MSKCPLCCFCSFTEDFPNGTWLGDEHNPEMRVRVPITPRLDTFLNITLHFTLNLFRFHQIWTTVWAHLKKKKWEVRTKNAELLIFLNSLLLLLWLSSTGSCCMCFQDEVYDLFLVEVIPYFMAWCGCRITLMLDIPAVLCCWIQLEPNASFCYIVFYLLSLL